MTEPLIDNEPHNSSDQYLTFVLANEEYAIEIVKVQEIKSWTTVTPIPCSPEHLLGVINLRGAIVPIVDLRKQFSLPTWDAEGVRAVIIVRSEATDNPRTLGLLVDEVSDVYHAQEQDIQDCDQFSTTIGGDFISGLSKRDESLVILINLEGVVEHGLDGIEPNQIEAANADA